LYLRIKRLSLFIEEAFSPKSGSSIVTNKAKLLIAIVSFSSVLRKCSVCPCGYCCWFDLLFVFM